MPLKNLAQMWNLSHDPRIKTKMTFSYPEFFLFIFLSIVNCTPKNSNRSIKLLCALFLNDFVLSMIPLKTKALPQKYIPLKK